MYGAMIGDIVGSRYEFIEMKDKSFTPLFSRKCSITDDTVMTAAVASALILSEESGKPFQDVLVSEMQRYGREYPYAGYGGMFARWLESEAPQPYGSYGNGSAMRVSPCGLWATSLEEALKLAKLSAEVTHNHREGICGAQAVAGAVYLAKAGASKEEIRKFASQYYDLHRTVDQIRPGYHFEVSCQKSVPEAITAFLESENFEDAIRLAVSLGGDSDTQGAIAGSIAWTFYLVHPTEYDKAHNREILTVADTFIPQNIRNLASKLNRISAQRFFAMGNSSMKEWGEIADD